MEKVILRYDGLDLANHSMELNVLTEALSGLNSLINEVHLELNGTNEDLKVEVQGGFDEGSFEFIVNVIEATDIGVLAAIGFGGPVLSGGLMGAIKWLKGEKIEKLSYHQNGNCIVHKENGDTLEVHSYLNKPLASSTIRASFKKLIKAPLTKSGIDVFEVLDHQDRHINTKSNKQNAKYFRSHKQPVNTNEDDDVVIDGANITFISVHSDKQSGWRIYYDDNKLTVKMSDSSFMRRIENGVSGAIFDDAFSVRLVIKNKPNSISEKTYTIEEVYI